MAGEAKTNAFMLGTATVMIGAPDKLFELNPAAHSIGLVKNFQITAEPTYTELTQGVKNQLVYSVMTANPIKASMEVYEFTAKNLAYGLGLDGSTLAPISTNYTLKTAIEGAAGTGATGVQIDSASDISADFPVGTWISIQEGSSDQVHVAKVLTAAYATQVLTLTFDQDIPVGVNFTTAAKVSKVNAVDVGAKTDQPYFAAKVVGLLPEKSEPITLLLPKLRISKGFTLAFHTDNFGNLPFEFSVYELVASDTLYSTFKDAPVKLLGRM